MGVLLLQSPSFWVDEWASLLLEKGKLGIISFLGQICLKDFMEDFCIYSSRQGHCDKLPRVFQYYDECGGQLNPKKCFLAQPRVKFLGHVVSKNGIDPDPYKVKSL